MNKMTNSKTKYCIQFKTHPRHTFKGLCSLMEHQSLVDIAICCGNNTMHAHKCVLAANSPLFRDELEKNSSIEQVIISGCDFTVMKSIIEIMYCGETTISEEYIKYLIAAAKTFQMKILENLFLDKNIYHFTGDEVFLPKPQFLSKKPKYPTAFHPFNTNTPMPVANMLKPVNYSIKDAYNQRRIKRKYIRAEAEKACAKEAQASRMALANLQKEIASTPQVNSFIIEESCTETTVENFIPHSEENFVDKLNDLQQIQVVNFSELENNVYSSQYDMKPSMIQLNMQNKQNLQGLTTDKIKHILGNEIPSNVEIMFKTNEGNFVRVTDEVLQNISKSGLQYQVVDENGHMGEVQELQVLDKENKDKGQNVPKDMSISNSALKLTQSASIDTASNLSKLLPGSFMTSQNFLNNMTGLLDPNTNQILGENLETGGFDKDIITPIRLETGGFGENAFSLHNSGLFDAQNGIDNEMTDNKPIQFIPLTPREFMNSTDLTGIGSGEQNDSSHGFYNLDGGLLSNSNLASAGNKNDRGGNTPRKMANKFSPDMFFADLPNENLSKGGEIKDNIDLTNELVEKID